jgi:hypothetical protein
MIDDQEIHERPSQFTQDSSGNIIVGLNQTTVIPRVPSEKVRHRQADRMQQLSEKYKGAEDLNKMIQNPDELERLLNELVDYFHQLHFLAVIVNLFNVINASTGFAVNIKKNSSGTTSLELQRTQNDLSEGVTPSTLPAGTRKMFGKGVDPKAGQQAYTDEHKQLQTDHDQLKRLVELLNAEIDAHRDDRNQLNESI